MKGQLTHASKVKVTEHGMTVMTAGDALCEIHKQKGFNTARQTFRV